MFTKSKKSERHIKCLVWGEPGTGKTLFALNSEKPAIIDLERGAECYGGFIDYGVLKPQNFDEIMDSLDWLSKENHGYKTLIIDSASEAWAWCMSEMMEPSVQPDWFAIKKKWKGFLRQIRKLPMDVILTARAKDTKDQGKWWVRTGGKEADAECSTQHDLDYVLFSWTHFEHGEEPEYKVRVEKARDITRSMPGIVVSNLTFKHFKNIVENVQIPPEDQNFDDLPPEVQWTEKAKEVRNRLKFNGYHERTGGLVAIGEILGREVKNFSQKEISLEELFKVKEVLEEEAKEYEFELEVAA